jgi:hypothetical protein
VNFSHIRQYILDNAARWKFDRKNPAAMRQECHDAQRILNGTGKQTWTMHGRGSRVPESFVNFRGGEKWSNQFA